MTGPTCLLAPDSPIEDGILPQRIPFSAVDLQASRKIKNMIPQFKTELDLSPCPDGRTWRLDQDFIYQSAIVAQALLLASSPDWKGRRSDGNWPPASTGVERGQNSPAGVPAPLGTIVVTAGFITDLASIPRLFWDILPPFGKYTEAAVIHDWLYRHHLFPRAACDAVLLEAMQLCRVGWISRQLIYRNVRAFGWAAWAAEPSDDRAPKTANSQSAPAQVQSPEP